MTVALPTLYRGSVKEVHGPIAPDAEGHERVVFAYSDAFSVFDWGRMPDALERKGEALAVLTAQWFTELEDAASWREFSGSAEALALRRGNRFGARFIERGERLQAEGLRTHFAGVWDEAQGPQAFDPQSRPFRSIVVRQVHVRAPREARVLGREVFDYAATFATPTPRLVPLEVVFRFGAPAGSSLRSRLKEDPGYLARRGFEDAAPGGQIPEGAGAVWGFPTLEAFTKLETRDRVLEPSEALLISGLSGENLEELYFLTAWTAAWLRWRVARAGVELLDGKLEWGLGTDGRIFLVDAIGPDELRLSRGGAGESVALSKEFLRDFYRSTSWYAQVTAAKDAADRAGATDWKRLVKEPAPKLPEAHQVVATQLYWALANALTGRVWFPGAWSLDQVVAGMRKLSQSGGAK